METVRAATLASSHRQKRLQAAATPQSHHPLPLATSSPSNHVTSTTTDHTSSLAAGLPSPVPGRPLPEELIRYKNQTYVAPEKLQIVKPLEGSVTLLKWKLLATPQLGGATTFFSDASRPGVHLKKWKAGGVQDNEATSSETPSQVGSKDSTTDITSLEQSHLEELGGARERRGSSSVARDIRGSGSVARDTRSSLSNSVTLHGSGVSSGDPATNHKKPLSAATAASSHKTSANSSLSLLGQVGSFLGSSWSRLSLQGEASKTPSPPLEQHNRGSTQHEPEESTGLASLLDMKA